MSAFVHIWNPIGFPPIGADEGVYMRRALHVLEGLGPQEYTISYYDHPYFGQLFLAGVFKVIGYPDIVHPALEDKHSIEMLYTVPRVLMGLLAVVDTFLVYKIAELRYNRNVALIASILFAVMPITWLLRLILLDTILLPFLLSSVLFAVYIKYAVNNNQHKKTILLTLLSGIFLGLAIFTKASAFTMIPLVGFLIYTNGRSMGWKRLGLWLIPLVLIPAIWPGYAIYQGEFDKWVDGVSHQATERAGHELSATMYIFVKLDPVLFIFGFACIAYSTIIKRDAVPLIWVLPLMSFFYLSNYSSLFHFNPLLPAFCIAAGIFGDDLSTRINKMRQAQQNNKRSLNQANNNFDIVVNKFKNTFNIFLNRSSLFIAIGLGIFGLGISSILVTTNIAAFQFDALSDVAQQTTMNNNVTIISTSQYSWIFQYVFGMNSSFGVKEQRPVTTEHAILMIDENFKDYIANRKGDIKVDKVLNTTANTVDDDLDTIWSNNDPGSWILIDLGSKKALCGVKVSWFNGDKKSYNLAISTSDNGTNFKKIYWGKSNTSSYLFNKYDLGNNFARYIKMNFYGNSHDNNTALSEIDVYGYTGNMTFIPDISCKNLQIANISAPQSAAPLFDGYDTAKGTKSSYVERIRALYTFFPIKVKFVGSAEYFDTDVYPYTSMGYYRSGSSIEIRAN